ncbi:MAG TPA: glycosyltransferase family 4 protein [Bacilli bacterium]|nr:glycosyltransferase family 4 protein [Bacilli bacterium]
MNKNKKLVLFSHLAIPTHITGAELYLLACLEQLSSSFQCTLISPGNSLLVRLCHKIGVETIIFPFPMLWRMWKPTKNLKKQQKKLAKDPSVYKIAQLLDELKADTVITNSCINIIPALAAAMNRLPVSWIIHETIEKNTYSNEAINFIINHSTHLIGASKTVLQPFYHKGIEPILIYPFSKHMKVGIDENVKNCLFRQLHDIPQNALVIGLAAAQLTKEKGLDDFLYLAERISQKNVLFLLVGHLPEHEFVKQCNVHHLPFINEMVSFYCGIDLLIVPSLVNEGFPLTALEASFYGKPVIAYRSGGLIEQMESLDNKDFLVTQGDRAALLKKVCVLIDSSALRTEIGAKLCEKSRQLYGRERFHTQLNSWSELL